MATRKYLSIDERKRKKVKLFVFLSTTNEQDDDDGKKIHQSMFYNDFVMHREEEKIVIQFEC
jgi:hypothetical protein